MVKTQLLARGLGCVKSKKIRKPESATDLYLFLIKMLMYYLIHFKVFKRKQYPLSKPLL